MSSKEDLLDWNDGVVAYEGGNYSGAITYFQKITSSVGARIWFNMGMAYGAQNKQKEAIDCFTSAVRADKYLAVAYFMRGFYQIQLRGYGKALQDYDNAAQHMRGNALIDYKQLGMDFKLYYAEVMFNRGMVQHLMQRHDEAMNDLRLASQAKMEKSHDIIDQTLSSKRFDTPFSCPKGAVYRPPEQKLKNAQKVEYIKRDGAKLVAATDSQDQYTGFKDAQIRKQVTGRGSDDEQPAPRAPPSSNATPRGPPAGGAAPRPPAAVKPPAPAKVQPPPARAMSPPPSRAMSPPAASFGGGGGSGGSGPGGKIKVKCHSADTRIVPIEPDIGFDEFKKRVQEKFDGQSASFKYKDEDGDMVLLVDQEDLRMAMATPDALAGKFDIWLS